MDLDPSGFMEALKIVIEALKSFWATLKELVS